MALNEQSTNPAYVLGRLFAGQHAGFNPRSRRGERPGTRREVGLHPRFNPRSRRGERRAQGCQSCHSYTSFNPRSRRGERRPQAAGRSRWARRFNPRSRRGERRLGADAVYIRPPFQSTLPARGATTMDAQPLEVTLCFNPRSRRGERPKTCPSTPSLWSFNPRSRREERQENATTAAERGEFQSTLPARGATSTNSQSRNSNSCFNPRSRRGERRCTRC